MNKDGQDWGPIPELAAALAGTGPVASCFQLGGPWALLARRQLFQMRGRSQPLPSKRRHRGFWRRFWLWLCGLFGYAPAKRIARTALPHNDLPTLMNQAHCWLASRNFEAIVPSLRSFPDAAAPRLATISDIGVFWAITAWYFINQRRAGAQLVNASSGKGPADWRPTRFADQLALHFCVEQVILALAPANGHPSPTRAAGGLRRPEVLRAATALGLDTKGPWPELRPLLVASPLTLLVYGDVCSPDEKAAETARLALQFDPDAGDAAWHARWLTLLARSMTGMVLSPPQVEELLAVTEARLAKLREEPLPTESVVWLSRNEPTARERASADLTATEHFAAKLRKQRREQCLARLRYLSEVLAIHKPDPAVFRASGAEQAALSAGFFVARTWDMLIRTLLARQTAGILKAWPAIKARGLESERARDALVIGGEDGSAPSPLASEVLNQLTHLPFSDLAAINEKDWSRTARERLFDVQLIAHPETIDEFENFPPGTVLAALAQAARVAPNHMRMACERLGSGADGMRVPLPIPPPDERLDRPPAEYLRSWGRMVTPRTQPKPEATVHTTQETYYEDE